MNKQDEYRRFAVFCLGENIEDFDQHALTRFVERQFNDMSFLASYLVNVQYSPHLLREFVHRHWNAAIGAPVGDDALTAASDVMTAMEKALTAEEKDAALECIARNYPLPLPTVRKLCDWLNSE